MIEVFRTKSATVLNVSNFDQINPFPQIRLSQEGMVSFCDNLDWFS